MQQERRERGGPDLARPDVRVPVPVRPAAVLGVIGVDQAQSAAASPLASPHDRRQRVEQPGRAAPRRQIVADRERVAGIQAQPGPRMPVHGGQVRPEVHGVGTQHLAPAGRRLQQQVRPVIAE